MGLSERGRSIFTRLVTKNGTVATLTKITGSTYDNSTLQNVPTTVTRTVHAILKHQVQRILQTGGSGFSTLGILSLHEIDVAITAELPSGEVVEDGDKLTIGSSTWVLKDTKKFDPTGAYVIGYLAKFSS